MAASGLVVGLALVAAACSSGASSSSSTTSAPTTTTTASATTAAGQPSTAAIAAAWEKFFDWKTPVATRIGLLQDGALFARIIRAQAGSVLAQAATAKVTKVTILSPTQAKVTYQIVVGGAPEVTETGIAVNLGGSWKVGVSSFCGLLTLENGGKTSSLPAFCKSATSTS